MILLKKISTLFLLSVPALPAFTQKLKKADKAIMANLETHVLYLADDRLEGRITGTPGEKLASDYISSEFMKAGLRPKGDNGGWLQAFTIDEGKRISPDSYFRVNDQALVLNKDYFPLAFSATGTLEGSPAIALQEGGDPWFLDLKEMVADHQGDAHYDLEKEILARTKEFVRKGATAVLLFNSSKTADNLRFRPMDKRDAATVPLIYITREAKKKYMKDESATLDIALKVGFVKQQRTGHNVIGFVDNGAANTVIIGAHYDQPFQRKDSSMPGHGGADDNPSGVAATIELARMLQASRLKNNNYLFIAFSGEAQDQYGSEYFAGHSTVELARVNYMLNLDRIGGFSDSSRALSIGGYGTSPAWGEAIGSTGDRKYFALAIDSSGAGPGDQRSFCRKGIPVLFFSTGSVGDLHKSPGDTGKINYSGELRIVKYIYSVVENVNGKGRIPFANTRL